MFTGRIMLTGQKKKVALLTTIKEIVKVGHIYVSECIRLLAQVLFVSNVHWEQ